MQDLIQKKKPGVNNTCASSIIDKYYFSFTISLGFPLSLLQNILDQKISENGKVTVSSAVKHIYLRENLWYEKKRDKRQRERITEFSEFLFARGIKPVYLFDYTCFGDNHLTSGFLKNFASMLNFLYSCKIHSISVADFYISEVVNLDFKGFDLYISPRARINKAVKMSYLNNISAHLVTAHHDINSDIDEMQRLINICGTEKVEIILNPVCISHCPMEIWCRAMNFHVDNESESEDELMGEEKYYMNRCMELFDSCRDMKGTLPVTAPGELNPFLSAGIRQFRIVNDPDDPGELEILLKAYLRHDKRILPAKTERNIKLVHYCNSY